MAVINTSPVLRGGDYITVFEAGATTTLTDYTFPSVQETVFVRNNGVRDIRLIASGQTYKVPPNQSVRITENTTTVQVKSEFGTQPFTIEGRSGTASGGASSEIQRLDGQLADIMAQHSDKKIKVVACVLRNSGNGWETINDADHDPIGVASITNDTNTVYVNYDFLAKQVISFVACPDETFALAGYNFGASVGKEQARINIFQVPQTIGGLIVWNGSAWNFSSTKGVTGVTFASGELTITHSSMEGFVCNANVRDGVYVTSVGSLGTTTSKIKFFDYAGTLITTPDTNMKVYFQRSSPSGQIRPDLLINANGNIWCYGIFEV